MKTFSQNLTAFFSKVRLFFHSGIRQLENSSGSESSKTSKGPTVRVAADRVVDRVSIEMRPSSWHAAELHSCKHQGRRCAPMVQSQARSTGVHVLTIAVGVALGVPAVNDGECRTIRRSDATAQAEGRSLQSVSVAVPHYVRADLVFRQGQ